MLNQRRRFGCGADGRSPRRGNAAFGLIGLLLVVAIIMVLFAGNMGGGSYAKHVAQTRKQGRETANEISTQQLSILIAQYRQENGKLPTSPSDMEQPGVFNDQWGHEMRLTFETDKFGKTKVTYHSDGPDGEPNTPDDVARTDTLPF